MTTFYFRLHFTFYQHLALALCELVAGLGEDPKEVASRQVLHHWAYSQLICTLCNS